MFSFSLNTKPSVTWNSAFQILFWDLFAVCEYPKQNVFWIWINQFVILWKFDEWMLGKKNQKLTCSLPRENEPSDSQSFMMMNMLKNIVSFYMRVSFIVWAKGHWHFVSIKYIIQFLKNVGDFAFLLQIHEKQTAVSMCGASSGECSQYIIFFTWRWRILNSNLSDAGKVILIFPWFSHLLSNFDTGIWDETNSSF
jgi:hypothetical protein